MLSSWMRVGMLAAAPLVIGAVACGSDDDDPSPSSEAGASGGGSDNQGGGDGNGEAGSGASAAGAGSGGTSSSGGSGAEAGGGGAPGSAGTSSQGGAGLGGAGVGGAGVGGAGGGLDAMSTACSALPATIVMGPTNGLTTVGAVLCYSLEDAACRVTTNTYSDGTNPCPNGERLLGFYSETDQVANRIHAGDPEMVAEIISLSSGTINQEFPSDASGIAAGTSVTTVIEVGQRSFQVVFTFSGASLTVTSFNEVL